MSNESTNPDLSIYTRADWLGGFLRADRIRFDTLVQLVASWGDEDAREEVIEVLDALAEVVQYADAPEGAVDAAVESVEEVTGMDTAQVPIDKATALRLKNELFDLTQRLCRFEPGRSLRIPRQSGTEAV